MLVMPSNTSAWTRPATPSSRIFAAVGVSSARLNCSSIPGYFFSNAALSGRMAWFTIRVVYQTTLPSFLAASTSAGSAATAFPLAMTASATATARADRCRIRAASMAGARGHLACCRGGREIVAEPATQQLPDAGIAFAEHEMVGIADEVQLGGLAGALEQLDRLFGRGDRVIGGVQQQQRPRRDAAHDVVRAEVEHALRGLRRERVDGVGGEVVAQMRRD